MYYVAIFDRDEQWWFRDDTAYTTFDAAYETREKILEECPAETLAVAKVEVWTKNRWESLPIGYKHPQFITERDRETALRKNSDPTENKEREKIKEFNELETDLAQALREAGR